MGLSYEKRGGGPLGVKQNPPGEPEGLKQLKTNYCELIRTFAVQEGIDRTNLRVVVLVGFYFVIAIKVFDVGDRVVQF
jgi:hypothetical protein